jgi:2-polyprenyl-3-methyl-5-hydroxy-6-metoxy-1,4-benzoquinol methylase
LKPGRILDLACGVGYGTELLAAAVGVEEVLGVDIDPEAIAYARDRYPHPRAPRGFIERVVQLIGPGGRVIASAPVTPSMDARPRATFAAARQC